MQKWINLNNSSCHIIWQKFGIRKIKNLSNLPLASYCVFSCLGCRIQYWYCLHHVHIVSSVTWCSLEDKHIPRLVKEQLCDGTNNSVFGNQQKVFTSPCLWLVLLPQTPFSLTAWGFYATWRSQLSFICGYFWQPVTVCLNSVRLVFGALDQSRGCFNRCLWGPVIPASSNNSTNLHIFSWKFTDDFLHIKYIDVVIFPKDTIY